MNNSELVRILDYDDLLSVSELLCIALRDSRDGFLDLDKLFSGWLSDEVFEYIEKLTEYECLKLIKFIIDSLIHETKQPQPT